LASHSVGGTVSSSENAKNRAIILPKVVPAQNIVTIDMNKYESVVELIKLSSFPN